MTREQEALIEVLKRKNGARHPFGRTDNGGRWYPSDTEKQVCCGSVRSPSRSFPWSYMTHCRTMKHVCHLYGVKEQDVRALTHKKNLPLLIGLDPSLDKVIESKMKV